MKLVKCDGSPCYVNCCKCGIRTAISECLADLDGKAFQAYYCHECSKELLLSGQTVQDNPNHA